MKSELYQTIALQDGKSVHISQVMSGLACNCLCPACGQKMVARKGSINAHHFAHYNPGGGDGPCEYGYETSLHLMAKEILQRTKRIVLPWTDPIKGCETAIIDEVELERKLGRIIPDIVLTCGKQKLIVEIFVTHKVDGVKKQALRDIKIPAIEIDLSEIEQNLTEDELRDKITNHFENRYWLNYGWKSDDRNFLIPNCPECGRKLWEDGDERHEGLPYMRHYNGTRYHAGPLMKCYHEDDDIVDETCRFVDYETDAFSHRVKPGFIKPLCPECGGMLHIRYRNDGSGKFWGCSCFPDCRFSAAQIMNDENCLKCGSGIMLYRGGFWGCSRYPKCDYKVNVL